jgi:hypothetical protein
VKVHCGVRPSQPLRALEGFVLMDELIVKILHGEKIGHIKIL